MFLSLWSISHFCLPETKAQFARDDPAFLVLLLCWICGEFSEEAPQRAAARLDAWLVSWVLGKKMERLGISHCSRCVHRWYHVHRLMQWSSYQLHKYLFSISLVLWSSCSHVAATLIFITGTRGSSCNIILWNNCKITNELRAMVFMHSLSVWCTLAATICCSAPSYLLTLRANMTVASKFRLLPAP